MRLRDGERCVAIHVRLFPIICYAAMTEGPAA